MKQQSRKSVLGSVSRSHRRLISDPGAAIRVEAIELTGELGRALTTTATSIPAYRPERRRRR